MTNLSGTREYSAAGGINSSPSTDPGATPGVERSGFWNGIFRTIPRERADTSSSINLSIPHQFCDCASYEQKVVWLQSERGQSILSQRPVLNEHYRTGRIFRMLKNRHWDQRLNEWLYIPDMASASSMPVPMGLTLPVPQELQPRSKNELRMHPHNPPIREMFKDNPTFCTPMEFPTASKIDLLTDGFTIFRGIVPQTVIEAAGRVISQMIVESDAFNRTEVERQALVRQHGRHAEQLGEPFFTSGGTNDPAVLALFYTSPVASLVEGILHNYQPEPESSTSTSTGTSTRTGTGNAIPQQLPPFEPRVDRCQVAYRFSQPRPRSHTWWSKISNSSSGGGGGWLPQEGRRWHLDGMDKGVYSPFSLLIGVALSDQMNDFSGNLCLHAGSHHSLKEFIKTYAAASDEAARITQDAIGQQTATTTTTTTTTTTAPVGLAAEVREETKNAAVYFLRHGMAELTLDIVSHYSRDRLLVHSTLVFVHKLVYRGRYICCLRLLTIGFCEELTELMRTYIGDQEIYMLCTMILSSMASSHPLLVGTGRRFVSSYICELLVSSLRRQCHEKDDRSPLDEQQHQQQQQVVVDGSAIRSDRKCSSDARRWMHYSYPYCCRVCLVHCTAVYCLVTHSGGERGYATGDVIHALRREGFQGLLVNAPGIQLDPHQLLHSSHITTVGSAAVDANTAAAPQLDPTAVVKKGGFGQDEVLNSNGDATATGAGRSDDAAEDDGRLLASGVFHNASSCIAAFTGITNNPASGTVHSASAIPPRKNYTAAAMGGGEGPTAMQTAAATSNEYDRQMLAYQGAVRNVEYLARMTRSEKDHIMNTLFNIFNVEESPNLLV